VHAQAAANPQLGRRMDYETLSGQAERVSEPGADPAEVAGFLTEVLCMRVDNLDSAIDPVAWQDSFLDGDMAGLRSRVALVIDVSPDRQHATLVAAAVMPDQRVRVEPVKAWAGPTAVAELRRELPVLVRKIRPQAFGWIPGGPAAAAAGTLAVRKGRAAWPPPGVTVEEITGEVSAICMSLAAEVDDHQVVHANDPLLNAHITGAAKLWTADRWRFERQGDGHCDAAYAVAGAVHLARTLPTPVGKPRIIVAR
jgi:hypothetical protein